MKLNAWIEKKLESSEFRNQYISDLKEENKRLESKLKVAVDALDGILKLTNADGVGPHCCLAESNFICCRAHKALKTIQGKGDGG